MSLILLALAIIFCAMGLFLATGLTKLVWLVMMLIFVAWLIYAYKCSNTGSRY